MKKIFTIIILLCISFSIQAQTLHTLVFINKCEKGSEICRTADYNKSTTFFTDVANRLGYTNNLRMFTCNEFTVANAVSEVRNLNVKDNDVVIFYYHGHGTNLSIGDKYDRWPAMHIWPDDNVDISTFLEQSKLKDELKVRCSKAKLVLCIADCCNSFSYGDRPATQMDTRKNDNIKKLFTGFSGKKFIMISASKPGQYGYCNIQTGSILGDYFREAINYYSEQSNPTWDQVLSRTQINTKSDLSRSNLVSEPQYEITDITEPVSGGIKK